ncbi:hypothetical protein SAMN05216316_1969 [Nitrosovibrio sp. Nv6]|nr:hypothetical protein SAMN05216316_1969 [Nitrosovibrio sp. Nv6]
MMEKVRKERILILAKTYPSPSTQYVETSCIAGINEHAAMRHMHPVPFRLIGRDQQFRRWSGSRRELRKRIEIIAKPSLCGIRRGFQCRREGLNRNCYRRRTRSVSKKASTPSSHLRSASATLSIFPSRNAHSQITATRQPKAISFAICCWSRSIFALNLMVQKSRFDAGVVHQ